ncbi:MAG: DUF2442 domain-containing protein [Desulfococcaceae bacterium]|nr:DUF2442 domain-containing protein [Desulfococcaceae bacterium]
MAEKLSFDPDNIWPDNIWPDNIWIELKDGRQPGVPLAYFPRLLNAEAGQLEKYIIISGGGTGLHWDDLDEDISVESLLLGIGDKSRYGASFHKKAS